MTLTSQILGSLAKLPRAKTTDISVDRDLQMNMPDGVILLADRWYPNKTAIEQSPIILMRSPYGRRQFGMIGRLFAERGYQVVIQSCRGTYGSGGNWFPLQNEEVDGRATLDWIAEQPWFEGKLATFGGSYLGFTQWAIAPNAPEYLKAVALSITTSNSRDVIYPSGGFALELALTWASMVEQEHGLLRMLVAQLASRRVLRRAYGTLPSADADLTAVGRHVPFFQDWIRHEDLGDTWWKPFDFSRGRKDLPPASIVGGWYDLFLPSQLEDYQALKANGRSASLTVGPWSHVSLGPFAASMREGLTLFDAIFSDDPSQLPPNRVHIFVMGSRRWIELPEWPPPCEEQLWYLGASGRLHRSSVTGSTPSDRYRYNPADPTPGIGGPSLDRANAGPRNQRSREHRSDVLTYTSDALTEELTVIGPLHAELHVRSTLKHTDFFVRLCDVSPRGRSKIISDGFQRLLPGDVTKSTDGSYSVRIVMWPTANTFRRGHRLRLQVSSGAHPMYMRNTGSGEPLQSTTGLAVAVQEIFHDVEHPSVLVLPVSRV
jgi:hypothetical protein